MTSAYYYRSYDFAALFNEFDKRIENSFEFRDESIVKAFIACYMKKAEKLFGKQYSDNKFNSVEHILMETKTLFMVNSLFKGEVLVYNDFWKIPLHEETILVNIFMFFLLNYQQLIS